MNVLSKKDEKYASAQTLELSRPIRAALAREIYKSSAKNNNVRVTPID